MSAISVSRYPEAISETEVELKWRQAFSNARMAVSFATPLFAHALFQCDIRWTRDLPTAAATVQQNKNVIYLNPEFTTQVLENDKQVAFVLLHEVLHIFLMHIGRQTDMSYNGQLWNIATDYCINLICSGAYLGEDGRVSYAGKYQTYMERPADLLYDEKFIGMSSDEIYWKLIEEADGDVEKAIDQNGGGYMGDGDSQVTLDEVSSDQLDNAQQNRTKRTVSTAIASTENSNGIGENEGDIVRSLRDMFKPKISWKEQLQSLVAASQKEYTTYSRLSRRSNPIDGIVFPSMDGEKINVVFGVDTSGSMGEDDLKEAASELYGILDQFEGWEVDLISCDTRAHLIGEYSSENQDEFSDISLEWTGGGGTRMAPLFDYASDKADLGDEVNACIIITDGHIPEREVDGLVDFRTIFVVTTGGNNTLAVENAEVIFMDNIGK